MLTSMKNQRETFMTSLMDDTTIRVPTNGIEAHQDISYSQPTSFFDNLYQTNSIYRHLNPQQPLEVSEKLPIVHHDQLSIVSSSVDEDDHLISLPSISKEQVTKKDA